MRACDFKLLLLLAKSLFELLTSLPSRLNSATSSSAPSFLGVTRSLGPRRSRDAAEGEERWDLRDGTGDRPLGVSGAGERPREGAGEEPLETPRDEPLGGPGERPWEGAGEGPLGGPGN